jgi:hypothetical protein
MNERTPAGHGRPRRPAGRGVRGRPPSYSRRYHLTLEPAEADLLDAYAEQQAKPTATVAARLLATELRRVTSGTGDELAEAVRQLEQLRTSNAALRRRLNEAGLDGTPEIPRWERPLSELLGDRDWWTTWLPRLYQLLGRQSHMFGRNRIDTLDDRGYPDLMAFLFPPVRDRGGRVVAEWHSPYYADHARSEWEFGRTGGEVAPGSARPAVWEPVVRHVAVALCVLEQTALPGADPLLRIRAEDDITAGWLRTLHRLTGSDAPELPAPLE